MAEPIHQPQTPVKPAETTIVAPRSEEATAQVTTDSPDKAAREAKERMSKTQGFWNRLAPTKEGGEKPDKSAESQPDKPPKKEAEGATSAEAKPAKAQDKKPDDKKDDKKPTRRRTEPDVDPIEIARATGEEIGRQMAKAAQPITPQATPAKASEPELPEEFRSDAAVFEEMARLDPKRYGNIKRELAQYAQAETDYIAKWEKEHDGETFDGDADEHDAFYNKIRPNYDQKDFKAAEKSLLKNEVRNEVRKEVSEEIRTREVESERRREKAAQIQPEVDRLMIATLGDMIREVDPDNGELAKDWASMQTLDEKNPLLADVMVAVHNETKPAILSTMRLFRSVEAPDANNPVHQRVFNLIENAEQRISQLPIKQRYDEEGRLFATQSDYSKMSTADKAKHWYIGEQETIALLKGQAIAQTKDIYKRKTDEIARYTKRQNATEQPKPAEQKKTDATPPSRSDNGSPSVSGRGTLPGDGQSSASKPATGRDLLFNRILGA